MVSCPGILRNRSGVHPGRGIYFTYLTQWLQIRWRRWLSGAVPRRVAGRPRLLPHQPHHRPRRDRDRQPGPAHRRGHPRLCRQHADLGVSLLANIVTLVSFLGILWSLSGTVTLFGVAIPGYMVWVALAYAVVGTWLTHLVGRPLAALWFRQQRVEADFRYSLVRVRENMEGIALYSGEIEEKGVLGHRFVSVIGNWWGIMRRTKMLNALTAGYEQVAVVFPFIVAATRFFSGQIPWAG